MRRLTDKWLKEASNDELIELEYELWFDDTGTTAHQRAVGNRWQRVYEEIQRRGLKIPTRTESEQEGKND